jgi:hypothetical protein
MNIHGGRGNVGARKASGYDSQKHYTYPETIGGQYNSNLNYNSHSTSEFAIDRMGQIDSLSNEPFVLFEFMRINTEAQNLAIEKSTEATEKLLNHAKANALRTRARQSAFSADNDAEVAQSDRQNMLADAALIEKANPDFTPGGYFSGNTTAERSLTGSIALYMPTDIQISDSIGFSEDSRKFGAAFENLSETASDGKVTSLMDAKAIALGLSGAGTLAGKFSKSFGKSTGAILGAIGGYGIGDIIQSEYQRSTGKTGNPNEFLAYKNTSLRSFTMNWKILPDTPGESKAASGLIEFFRVSAHAQKVNALEITVPDHVVTSFHGAAEMIQIPPCYIETVNVTYNPNVSSFFKHGNAPVEVDLSVTFKEIVPIYKDDIIERGY